MKFNKLAKYFNKLEETPSRLEMTRILAQLFKEADENEIKAICYLSLGRLVPLYKSLEFNLAEKMVIRSIASAFGVESKWVLGKFKKSGDLGEVVQDLKQGDGAPQQKDLFAESGLKLASVDRSVLGVYKALRQVAKEEGQGSQERKVRGLVNIINSLDGLSVRYVVRLVAGKLRLGFSDKTMIDGLSWMLKEDKSLRDEIERAYFLKADIGEIAEGILKNKGLKGIKKIKPELGVPIVPALCQRLKTADEMIEKMGKVAVEPKWDGVRCITGHSNLLVRKRGLIVARNINEGDEVLTHKGRFKPVEAIHYRRRKPGERMFKLQTYLGQELRVSEGHKLLVKVGERLKWLPIESIEKTKWLYFPKVKVRGKFVPKTQVFLNWAGYEKVIPFNKRLFRFLGYWVGDGMSSSGNKAERIGLIFNEKNKKLIEEYEGIIKTELGIPRIAIEKRPGSVVLYWRDLIFRKWLCKYFRGKNDSGKWIPEWFFGLDKDRFMAFLQGWKEADGTKRRDGNRIVTKERQLALMAQVLGFKHGVPIGIRKCRMRAESVGIKRTYYELIIPGTHRYIKPYKDGYIVRIRRLERFKVVGKLMLYDFQVKDDNSFCTSVATLHNCQIHFKGKNFLKTFTRNLDETTHMFPELKRGFKQIKAKSVILDCEGVGVNLSTGKLMSFQETIVRKRKHGIAEASKSVPMKFFVFDVIYKDGKSLINEPFYKRRKVLEGVIRKGSVFELADQIVTQDPEVLRKYHKKQLDEGLEGAVIKKIDDKYVPGRRGWSWVKFKEEETSAGGLSDTLDCVVMGYYRGKGRRASFGIGAFLVGVRKNGKILTVAKIGTGLSDEQWREIKTRVKDQEVKKQNKNYVVDKGLECDVWVDPKLVVEIAADNVTRSPTHSAGLALRFPRLVRFRDDKTIDQATSIKELKQLV